MPASMPQILVLGMGRRAVNSARRGSPGGFALGQLPQMSGKKLNLIPDSLRKVDRMGAGLKQVYKWGQPVSGASKPGQHEGVGYQENHHLLRDLNLGSEGALGGWGLGLRQSRP